MKYLITTLFMITSAATNITGNIQRSDSILFAVIGASLGSVLILFISMYAC